MANKIILSEKELNTLYNKYRASYQNRQILQRNKYGISMWSKPLSKIEFEAQYIGYSNDIMREKGWNTVKDTFVIDKIVERQATEFSEAQAKAYQNGMREKGKFLSMQEVYKTAPETVKKYNEELKARGVNDSYERKKLISNAFFGSE
jgi:hypothetical protein